MDKVFEEALERSKSPKQKTLEENIDKSEDSLSFRKKIAKHKKRILEVTKNYTGQKENINKLYAGPIKRGLAGVVDIIIAFLFFALFMTEKYNATPMILDWIKHNTDVHHIVINIGPFIFFLFLYYFISNTLSPNRTTIGKKMFSILVVKKDLQRINLPIALIRYLVAVGLFGLGYLTVPFTKEKRSLPDIITNTCVVNIKEFNKI